MYTLTSSNSIVVQLGASKTTNDCVFIACYYDTTIAGGITAENTNTGSTNGTAQVTVIAAPGSNTFRHLKSFTLRNTDTVATTVIVIISGVDYEALLQVGDVLQLSDKGDGWLVTDSNGARKQATVASWGTITGNITNQTDLENALAAKENTANKGAAGGYAPLNGSSQVPNANLPTATTSAPGIIEIDSATPSVVTYGGSGAAGSTGEASDAGHKHALAALPTASTSVAGIIELGTTVAAESYGATASAGVTGLASDAGHVHALPALPVASTTVVGIIELGTTVAAETSGAAGSAGATGKAADAGHVHAMPTLLTVSASNPAAESYGATAVVGSTGLASDAGHVHALPALPTASTSAAGVIQISTATPQTDGTATAGSTGQAADAGHIHASNLSSATPTASSYGGSGSAGTGTTVSRTDHAHALPALPTASTSVAGIIEISSATPVADTYGGAGSAGATGLAADAGHKHALAALPTASTSVAGIIEISSSSPGAESYGATAVAGSTGLAADAGHVHALPALPTASTSAAGIIQISTATPQTDGTATAGSTGQAADAGHVHASNLSSATPSASSYGGSGSAGVGTTVSRTDHAHALPALPTASTSAAGIIELGTTVAAEAVGSTAVAGSSGLASDAAHVHAMPTATQFQTALLVQPEGITSTATAGTTTTLTSASAQTQVFTGTNTQTIALPAANTLAFVGWYYCFINQSTSALTIQNNAATTITIVAAGSYVYVSCSSIGSAAGTWQLEYLGQTQPEGVASTATAASTTTLTVASTQTQIFTGSTYQTMVLPAANTLPFIGWFYEVINQSGDTITIQANGGSTLATVPMNCTLVITCTSIGSSAGTWVSSAQSTQMTAPNPNLYVTNANTEIPASSCLLINSGEGYEVGSGFVTDIASTAVAGGYGDGILEVGTDPNIPISVAANKAITYADNMVFPVNTAGGLVNDGAGNISSINEQRVQVNGLELWGHSYFDNNSLGSGPTAIWTNETSNPGQIYAASIGLDMRKVNNHAVVGAQLVGLGRASGAYGGGDFARVLGEIYRSKQSWPFSRSGNAHILCYGINDLGNYTVAQITGSPGVYTTAVNILTVLISKMRSAAIYNGNGGANLAYSGTWAAPSGATDYTSGYGWATSTTGGTFTFTIPYGYQGEPICFSMVGYNSSNALSVAWSGTAGVTGTTTLNSCAVNAESIVPFRITTLSAKNAGQTIIGTITLSSQTFILDSVWIEAFKPVPVLVCNTPRLPCKIVNIYSGSGVTAGGTTAFTDASGNFSSTGSFGVYNDVGAIITEIDAQGALTGNTATVASVTNATTLVLTANTAAAKTAIQYTIGRNFLGYPSYGSTNLAFYQATAANHSAADAQVVQWNTQVVNAVVALFDSMVQVVDLDAAIGADANLPSNVYSWFACDALHPNDLGSQRCALAIWQAVSKLKAPSTDVQNFGLLQIPSVSAYLGSPYRRIINSGQLFFPDGAQLDVVANLYTAVVGDCFAYPFMITESGVYPSAVKMEQISAGNSVLVAAWYDDLGAVNGPSGYPVNMRWQLGNYTMNGSANSVNTVGTFYRNWHPGLQWLVIIIQSLGTTTSTFRTMYGPCPQLPSWTGSAGSIVRPVAWYKSGVATGAPPEIFPTGAVLNGCGAGTFASASSAPVVGLQLSIQ